MRSMKSCVHRRTKNKPVPGRKKRRQPEVKFLSKRHLRLKPDVAQLQRICPAVFPSGKRE